jgi:hypothetical protein
MSGKPALGRPVLAILLFRSVLGGNEFRRQRNDLVMPRCHHSRRQHGVVIFRLPLASGPRRAAGAMDIPGTMMLRAVEGDQRVAIQAAEKVEPARDPAKLFDHGIEHRMQQFRRRRVQHVADMIVAWNLRQAEQALAVRPAMALFEPALRRQKRRALHEKHRKGRHPDVTHRVAHLQPPALVRKTVQAPPQRTKKDSRRRIPSSNRINSAVPTP